MDPRLWQLLNTAPGELFIRRMWLSHNNNTLTLECEAVNDVYPNGMTFELQFKNCRDIRWQSMSAASIQEHLQALGFYLGEQAHHKPAVVYTGESEMSVLYQELDIKAGSLTSS